MSTTTLAPGALPATGTADYTLTQPDIDAGEVENTAEVTGEDPSGTPVVDDSDTATDENGDPIVDPDTVDSDGDSDNGNDPTVSLIAPDPMLVLEKSAGAISDTNGDGIVGAGDTITYTFEVENTGNVTISNLVVTDALFPGGITLDVTTLSPGDPVATGTADYILTQADIDAGEVENTCLLYTSPSPRDS